jgi:hypothetical protein
MRRSPITDNQVLQADDILMAPKVAHQSYFTDSVLCV